MVNRSKFIEMIRDMKKQHEADGELIRQAEALLGRVSTVTQEPYALVNVRSHSRPIAYMVRLFTDPSLDSCQCESYNYRQVACKHIKEARLRAPKTA